MKFWPLLLIACSDPLAVCDDDLLVLPDMLSAYTYPENVLRKSQNVDTFVADMADGSAVVNGALYWSGDLGALVTNGTNTISLWCAGGWGGGQIIGDISLTGNEWEFRVRGCMFTHGGFYAAYVQESVLDGVYIQQPFVIDHASGITFRDLYAFNADIRLNETGRTTFDNAHIGDSQLYIRGALGLPNGWGGPVAFERGHLERSTLTIENASSVIIEGNYLFGSALNVAALRLTVEHNDALMSTLNGERMGCV